MAEGKKGFILYADQKEIFEQLSDQKAGQLIKHIYRYVNDENPKSKDAILNLAFTPIKTQLKRDLKHWEDIRQKRAEAGKKGGRPKKQIEAKKANGFFDKQTKAKKAVIVNDNVNVNVKDNVNVNERVLHAFKNNVINESKELGIDEAITNQFLDHWTARDFESGGYAWQVPETFIIKSRLKGWVKRSEKDNQEINYDIK